MKDIFDNLDLSIASPLTNSLTLVFTTVFGMLMLGEKAPSTRTFCGISLILGGILLATVNKNIL